MKVKLISLYIKPNISNKDTKNLFSQILNDNKYEKYVLIAGDINCHNALWERDSTNDRKGNLIAEILTESDQYCVLNDGSPTYFNLSRCYSSAIDATIASKELTKISEWTVDENLTSDHTAIITTIKSSQHKNTNIKIRKI